MAINYTQPSFSTGNVIDPARNALAAVATARESLADVLNQSMKQEALKKAEARQKILDDRATEEYNTQLKERNALSKFNKAILAPNDTVYGDANSNSKLMKFGDEIALTPEEMALQKQGKTTPAIEAKLKAQYDLGAGFDENAKAKETEWEKAQRIAKELGVGDSLAVNERLYSIKAADKAARKDDEDKATKQKAELLKQYNDAKSEYNKYSVREIGHYGASESKGDKSSNPYKNDIWTVSAKQNVIKNANKMTPYLWPGQGDSGEVKGLMEDAEAVKVGPKQFEQILLPYKYGDEERILHGERLDDPANKKSHREIIEEIHKKIIEAGRRNLEDALAAKSNKNSSGGFYNKKDTSIARQNLLDDMKYLRQQMNDIKTDYSTDLTPEERSQEAMNNFVDKLSKKYNRSKSKNNKNSNNNNNNNNNNNSIFSTNKHYKELVDQFKKDPKKFSKKYNALKLSEKLKMHNIVKSDPSIIYFSNSHSNSNKIPEKLEKDKYNSFYRNGEGFIKGISAKELKQLLDRTNKVQKNKVKTGDVKKNKKLTYEEKQKKIREKELEAINEILKLNTIKPSINRTVTPVNTRSVIPQPNEFIRLPEK